LTLGPPDDGGFYVPYIFLALLDEAAIINQQEENGVPSFCALGPWIIYNSKLNEAGTTAWN
jgi:hypothetical protein